MYSKRDFNVQMNGPAPTQLYSQGRDNQARGNQWSKSNGDNKNHISRDSQKYPQAGT